MKKLKSLNLGKSLNRNEMKSISGGKDMDHTCTCGTNPPVTGLRTCGCLAYCAGTCTED